VKESEVHYGKINEWSPTLLYEDQSVFGPAMGCHIVSQRRADNSDFFSFFGTFYSSIWQTAASTIYDVKQELYHD
jgi:hypothetical protein